MRAVPFHHLEGTGGDREERLRQPEEQRTQAGVAPPGGFRSVGGKGNRDARYPGEIAEVMKLSESATKSLLFRAYETLRVQLKELVLAK